MKDLNHTIYDLLTNLSNYLLPHVQLQQFNCQYQLTI